MAAAKKGGRGGEMVLETRHLFGLFVLLAVLFGVVFTLGYLLGRGQGDSQPRVAMLHSDDSTDTVAADPSAATSSTPDQPAATDAPSASTAPAASTGTDWSYYHDADNKPASDALEPAPTSKPAATTKPAAATKPAVTAKPTTPATPAAAPAPKPAATTKPAPSAPAAAKPAAKPAASSTSHITVGSPLIPKGAIVLQVAALEKESDAMAMAQALQQRKFSAFIVPPSADKYYRVQVGPFATAQTAAAAQQQLESQGFKSIIKR